MRVVSIGHSAGGHFALWLAARHRIPKSSDLYCATPLKLTGVVDLDGPGDLKASLAMPATGLRRSRDHRSDRRITRAAAGTLPRRIADRTAAARRYRQVFLAGRMFGPQAPGYEAAAIKAGDSIQVSVSDAGHFVFIDPASELWPTGTQEALRSVLSLP